MITEIVIVVPVHGRPQNAAAVYTSHQGASEVPGRFVFVCSPDDCASIDACKATGSDLLIADWLSGPADFARKVNHAYRETEEPWLFQAADDVRFQPGWDTAALACAEATGALVVGTQDGGNPMVKAGRHSTHTLIARSYCDQPGASWDGPGTVFSEAYDHQWTDVELVELAKARGVWAFAHDSHVLHDHPLWVGRAGLEEPTYRKGAAHAREDQRLYVRRSRSWRGKRLVAGAS